MSNCFECRVSRAEFLRMLNAKVDLVNAMHALYQESRMLDPERAGDMSLRYAYEMIEHTLDPRYVPIPRGFRRVALDCVPGILLPHFRDCGETD